MVGTNFFADLVLGHLIGDYLLQSRSMALNKSGKILWCLLHVTIYTLSVGVMTWTYFSSPCRWLVVVFASHFLIDYLGVADVWLEFIHGRSLKYFLYKGDHGISRTQNWDWKNYWCLRGGFTALVYAVVDNTLHFLVLWVVAPLLR